MVALGNSRPSAQYDIFRLFMTGTKKRAVEKSTDFFLISHDVTELFLSRAVLLPRSELLLFCYLF